jgi:hypothetical protein
MNELLEAVTSPWSLLWVVVVFGFAPGFCLRMIVRAYPRSDPRRKELIAELYAVPRTERLLWVAEQLEVALFEGLAHRGLAMVRRYPLTRRRVRQRTQHDQQLAWRVQDILVGCGLSQAEYSIGGGRVLHSPHVVSVVPGPPVGLNIRMLPGQIPDDFAAHAQKIAYHLGVAKVRVITLGPFLIQLELE